MKIPKEPGEIGFIFIALVATLIASVHEYITNPYMSYIKIFFSMLAIVFCIWLIKVCIKDYKERVSLAKRCTIKDFAEMVFIGVELRQGSDTHNSAFMILIFNGNEKRFNNINDEIRIRYSKETHFPIFYNPNDASEYVYDNTEFQVEKTYECT